MGLAPETPPVGGLLLSSRPPPRKTVARAGGLSLEVHGFLRAPLRVGFRKDDSVGLFSPGRVPDSEYQSWQYTNNTPGPWAQLNLSMGTPTAKGTVVLGSYSLSDAGFHNTSGQVGVFQAFLSLKLPRFANTPLRVEWTVGSFSNRYGAMGKYDAGRYETVIIGRTHLLGETLTTAMDFGPYTVTFEHGFGGKADHLVGAGGMNHLTTNPDLYGEGRLGSTLAHHAHLGLGYQKMIEGGLHFMHSFVMQDLTPADATANVRLPSPRQLILGADVRLSLGAFGDGYIGVSSSDVRNALYLQNAIEALNSFGGVALTSNFFQDCVPPVGGPAEVVCSGRITTVGLQYTMSLGALLRHPEPFWGNGPDLLVTVFSMYNKVHGRHDADQSQYQKFKGGAELTYVPLPWLALATRFDHVAPDSRDDQRTFQVFSPRLIFRTSVFAHEQIIFGYSRYFNRSNVTAPAPFQSFVGSALDPNMFYLAATMWW